MLQDHAVASFFRKMLLEPFSNIFKIIKGINNCLQRNTCAKVKIHFTGKDAIWDFTKGI